MIKGACKREREREKERRGNSDKKDKEAGSEETNGKRW
jgi:hypothetical protein